MAKGRHLKPDFFTDKNIVSVSPLARLLYQGLWCYAADCGHIEDEPLEFKLRILPADNCDVEELLSELVNKSRVVRQDGRLFLPTLREHGRIDRRYETMCDQCRETAQAADLQKRANETPVVATRKTGENTKGSRRVHDVITQGTRREHDADGDGDGDGDGDKNTRSPAAAKSPKPTRPPASADKSAERFEAFYENYPRKVGKGQARRAWTTAAKKADPSMIVSAAADFARRSAKSDPKFIPHPSTWLNGERWADEDATTPAPERPREPMPEPPSGLTDDEAAAWYAEHYSRSRA